MPASKLNEDILRDFSLLLDYAETKDGNRFLSTLKRYEEQVRHVAELMARTRDSARLRLVEKQSGIKADPKTVESLSEKSAKYRLNWGLAASTSLVAKQGAETAILYWRLFYLKAALGQEKDMGWRNQRFMGGADEIRDLACMLFPETAQLYLERLTAVFDSTISPRPGWPGNMPQTTQVLLYSAGESTPQVRSAFRGQSVLNFLKTINMAFFPFASELFMELLLSCDARLAPFYFEVANLSKGFQIGSEEETAIRYGDILSSMNDYESKTIRILEVAAEASEGNIDDLVILHQFRESREFMENRKLLLEGHKDALSVLAYLMLLTGKSPEADAFLHRVGLVEGTMSLLDRDFPVYERQDLVRRRKYAAEQAVSAILNDDAEGLYAVFAPKPEVIAVPVPPAIRSLSYDELARQSTLEASLQGVALYSLTDRVADKQFERLQFSSPASRFYSQVQKGNDFRKVPLPQKFFDGGFGLYLINHEPSIDLDEAALLVVDVLERENHPHILLVGPESFREEMAERLNGLVPGTAAILHYNNRSGNGYFNRSSIHIDDVIRASAPVRV